MVGMRHAPTAGGTGKERQHGESLPCSFSSQQGKPTSVQSNWDKGGTQGRAVTRQTVGMASCAWVTCSSSQSVTHATEQAWPSWTPLDSLVWCLVDLEVDHVDRAGLQHEVGEQCCGDQADAANHSDLCRAVRGGCCGSNDVNES